MDAPRGVWDRLRAKPFALLVVAAAYVYLGVGLLGLSWAFGLSLTDVFGILLLIFTILFLLSALGTVMVRRWGIIAGLVVTILFVVLFSFAIPAAFTNPASPGGWYIVSSVPLSVLAIILSIHSLVRWKAGVSENRHLASPYSASGLLTFAVLGFSIGAILVVTAASPLIVGLVANGGQGADIRIVPGAMSAAVPYSPATLTVTAGATVRWYNGDTNQHTVTSDTPGLFDSGNLDPGQSWSHTFATAGTFTYHCLPHPNMKGTIVVT